MVWKMMDDWGRDKRAQTIVENAEDAEVAESYRNVVGHGKQGGPRKAAEDG